MPSLAGELADPEESDGLLEPGGLWRDRWDRREDFDGDPIDLEVLGEDGEGIWVRRHPEALLVESPDLWGAVDRWRLGLREISPADMETMSAWEVHALLTMASADAREMRRRLKAGGSDGDESSQDRD